MKSCGRTLGSGHRDAQECNSAPFFCWHFGLFWTHWPWQWVLLVSPRHISPLTTTGTYADWSFWGERKREKWCNRVLRLVAIAKSHHIHAQLFSTSLFNTGEPFLACSFHFLASFHQWLLFGCSISLWCPLIVTIPLLYKYHHAGWWCESNLSPRIVLQYSCVLHAVVQISIFKSKPTTSP